MGKPAVVNASPLIHLARADLFDLLRLAGDDVFVTDAVSTEILARGPDDVTARAINQTDWITRVENPPVPPNVQNWDLGPGEASVIAWALGHPGSRAVIDDLEGRRCAETLGIPLRGTLGLVLRARKTGVIPQARPVLERLRATGMFLADRVLDEALAEVGE